MSFSHRQQAGRALGKKLLKFKEQSPFIFALSRGGVPVAGEVAKLLDAPLEVMAVRKIGVPFQPELAAGAIVESAEPVWNETVLRKLDMKVEDLRTAVEIEKIRIKEQIQSYREGKPLPAVKDRVVILIDDGIATGTTATAAVRFLKQQMPAKIIFSVPIAEGHAAEALAGTVDEVIDLEEHEDFYAIAQWYENFSQVYDGDVLSVLRQTKRAVVNMESLDEAINNQLIPLKQQEDLNALIDQIKDSRVVMLGEATHGTEEFYLLRRVISQRLIRDHGFRFIAVEGDWPDAYRLNNYIQKDQGSSAKDILMGYRRWPTWMWANQEIVRLAEWLRGQGAGFYGLDIYSLFDSMDEVVRSLKEHYPALADKIEPLYSCFDPYNRDEISYARSLLKNPTGCSREVLKSLKQVLALRIEELSHDGDELFNSKQNARIVANAENYYRAMFNADAGSWNIRDSHMMETLDNLLERYGEGAKAIVWAHNTHIGDYRATDMNENGYINIGGLARQNYGDENVALVGFGTYQGQVLAGAAWGRAERAMTLPPAIEGSYEAHFHEAALKKNLGQFYLIFKEKSQTPFAQRRGHRAVGVVYNPAEDRRSQYVPTELSRRYDAFVFVDRTRALNSLRTSFVRGEFPETWPYGQ